MNADDPSGTWAGAEPAALRRIPYALFAVPILLAHSRRTAGQNGASRGVPAPVALRVGCGAVQWRPGVAAWGAGCEGRGRLAAADVIFAKLRNNPPAGSDPREGSIRVAEGSVFAKLRNNPPAGYGTGGGTTRRKDTHRSRRTWSCEIAQRPSGAGGGTTRGRTGTGRGGRGFAKLRNDPPAGFGTGGGTTRGRTGTGRGGRGFAKLRNDPPAGFGTGGGHPAEGRAQVSADVVLRNCATTLPPGSARAGARPGGRTGTGRGGRGFCEIAQRPSRRGRLLRPLGAGRFSRNAQRPPGQAPQGMPSGQVPRGCMRCNSPAPAWWLLRAGWVFGAAHPHPRRFAPRPLPQSAGEVNMAAWRVRAGGPAAEGAAPRIKGRPPCRPPCRPPRRPPHRPA